MRPLVIAILIALAGCSVLPRAPEPQLPPPSPAVEVPVEPPKPETKIVLPKIALALGGGAARGFAHVGVIKALEANGIVPDIVVGTSAGSLVGAMYAAGYGAADLLRVALQIDDSIFADWSLPDRGFIRGEALQNFVNRAVQNRPLEKLNKLFGTVVTDLQSGQQVVFRTGNTGMAVRASSSVPGVVQPVTINGRDYVDGGLVSPVPVRAARAMGADVVIAVYVSTEPRYGKTTDSFDILLQTFAIMGQSIAAYELDSADVVIRPDIGAMRNIDFNQRQLAISAGEKAGLAAVEAINRKIAEKTMTVTVPREPAAAAVPGEK